MSAARRARRRAAACPIGCWPAEMRAEHAAGYVGELSVQAFLKKVDQAVYCKPARTPGCAPKWCREKLDLDLRRRHNLIMDRGTTVEDISDLI